MVEPAYASLTVEPAYASKHQNFFHLLAANLSYTAIRTADLLTGESASEEN